MAAKTNKVLILIPGENARGGITNYYQHIKEELPREVIYFRRGARNWPKRSGPLSELIRMASDYLRFMRVLTKERVALVQTTTAFYKPSILRDGIFLLLARWMGVKRIVFFRGWNDDFANNLGGLLRTFFNRTFFKAQAIIDLSQRNVDQLRQMGYTGKLYLETTLVGKDMVAHLNINELIAKRKAAATKPILYLSRLEAFKRIYELLQVYQNLKVRNSSYQLVFAGDGGEEQPLKEKINKEGITDVLLTGFVTGEQKNELFEKAAIFVFLSDFEGMPNAVLEAMAFGLPVVTTNVGGISTVFEHDQNGILLEKKAIDLVEQGILSILEDEENYQNISKRNYQKAREQFWSDRVGKRMTQIFNEVLANQ